MTSDLQNIDSTIVNQKQYLKAKEKYCNSEISVPFIDLKDPKKEVKIF